MQDQIKHPLQILYRDEHFVAVNKPCGYMVHKSSIARNATQFILQDLRDQIGQKVYPVHRLDRKTSGVLIMALNVESNRELGRLFAEREIAKEYTAIVRGWTEDEGAIDYALTNDSGKTQDAFTRYVTVKRAEIDLPHGKFQTSRYSLVKLYPQTGRMHQLRKHMSHIFHPILGDRPHGCNKQNRLWKDTYQMETMMLHADCLSFAHPMIENGIENKLIIKAPVFEEFERVLGITKLKP